MSSTATAAPVENSESVSDVSEETFHSTSEREGGNEGALPASEASPYNANIVPVKRKFRDVFWLLFFIAHLVVIGYVCVRLGLKRWNTDKHSETEDFWPMFAMGSGVGSLLSWTCLYLVMSRTNQSIKVAVHSVCTYLAVMSVFCFWDEEFFWGIVFALGALLQFLFAMSVMDRLAFTMLMVRKSTAIARKFPALRWTAGGFILATLLWMGLWTFGISGIVAKNAKEQNQWAFLLLLCLSLFWTGAVITNTLNVVVAGTVAEWLQHGAQEQESVSLYPTLRFLMFALTTSLGSTCYGSVFTTAIRTLRWGVRGFRARVESNECGLCCADLLFKMVEILVRFFNKYSYVTVAISGKNFNKSSRNVWELFQSTGVEALIAYDVSGAVVLMIIVLGGLMTGTTVGSWAWFVKKERVVMVGATSMLTGMILVAITMTLIESTVAAVYVIYAIDPTLLGRTDADFAAQLSETLHLRLQHRSGKRVALNLASSGLPNGVPKD